jgi:hypothetical protein
MCCLTSVFVPIQRSEDRGAGKALPKTPPFARSDDHPTLSGLLEGRIRLRPYPVAQLLDLGGWNREVYQGLPRHVKVGLDWQSIVLPDDALVPSEECRVRMRR